MRWIDGLQGVLLDIDGTLLDGDDAIPGAAAALARLRRNGIAYRMITNTTRRPRSAIAAALSTAGIPAAEAEILTPAVLARRRILDSGEVKAALLVPDAARADFEGIRSDEEYPDWVVLGDLGRGFTYDRINQAFHWLHGGARLLALQKNRFWKTPDEGLLIDAGAFVAGLEFAAGVTAEIIGKPSLPFFELALADLALEAPTVLMIGDDATTDGEGGARAGCRTALVRTGKFREQAALPFQADFVLDSVADLMT